MDQIKLLDHGHLKLIDKMGSDERIVEAARQSTGKGFLGWGPFHEERCTYRQGVDAYMAADSSAGLLPRNPQISDCNCTTKPGDEKLLAYLYENRHDTPFEMAELIFEVQAPIFVFREWHRHRTQSYNEASARYEPLPDLNYVPSVERLMINAGGTNKQAGTIKGAGEMDTVVAEIFRDSLRRIYAEAERLYQSSLAAGVPKELARVHLPVGRYSRMWAKANLRNWLAFLTLRSDNHAQWEIRQYAYAVGWYIAKAFPRTWGLFLNHDRKRPVIDRDGFLRIAEAA
jgi:thymidylate synthase (FAD)